MKNNPIIAGKEYQWKSIKIPQIAEDLQKRILQSVNKAVEENLQLALKERGIAYKEIEEGKYTLTRVIYHDRNREEFICKEFLPEIPLIIIEYFTGQEKAFNIIRPTFNK